MSANREQKTNVLLSFAGKDARAPFAIRSHLATKNRGQLSRK
jgi:hypothetical protein